MARGRGGRGRQQQIKGFRPGKEPPELRKQLARAQLGDDANWAQKKLVDSLAERSPEESRRMMGRWRNGALAAAIVLSILGAVLYTWSIVAGVIVHVLAVALFLFWFQLRRKQRDFDAMVDIVSGGGGGRGGAGGRGGGGSGRRRK